MTDGVTSSVTNGVTFFNIGISDSSTCDTRRCKYVILMDVTLGVTSFVTKNVTKKEEKNKERRKSPCTPKEEKNKKRIKTHSQTHACEKNCKEPVKIPFEKVSIKMTLLFGIKCLSLSPNIPNHRKKQVVTLET